MNFNINNHDDNLQESNIEKNNGSNVSVEKCKDCFGAEMNDCSYCDIIMSTPDA